MTKVEISNPNYFSLIFYFAVLSEETEIIQPFLLGCDTKSLRVVQICLTALQRLISHQAISEVRCFTAVILVNTFVAEE